MNAEQVAIIEKAGYKITKEYPKQPPQPRKAPMQVLCLGLSRTGTMSTYLALQKLGYKCYHMSECGLQQKNGSVQLWREAIDAKYFGGRGKQLKTAEDFDQLLWHYQALSDIPAVLFADELLVAYPNAKVILTERDVDSWLGSIERSFYEILSYKIWPLLQLIDRDFTRDYIQILRGALRVWTGDDWTNRTKLRQGFLAHNAHIRAVVPKERLLQFHPKDGWEPLCPFLGRPVPDDDFPRINEGSFVADLHEKLLVPARCMIVTIGFLKKTAPVVVLGVAFWAYRRYT